MEYLYNEKTGKLHIRGCCPNSSGKHTDYNVFATENDALAYGKSALSWCQHCAKKKEEKLKENL